MKQGEIIRNLRTKNNMTQEELSEKLGYKGRSSINKIEMNINQVPSNRITDFAIALNTTPSEILGIEDDHEFGVLEIEVVDLMDEMSDEGKLRIIEYAEMLMKSGMYNRKDEKK